MAGLLLLAGCGPGPEPALRVDGVAFAPDRVADLRCEQLEQLADLATLGVLIGDRERSADLVAPLAARETGAARLAALPAHLGARAMGVGEDRLRTAYAEAPAWELRVRHLVRLAPRWATPAERRAARAAAEEALRRARAGEDFGSLAGEMSEEPGAAARGGLLQPGREGSWVRPFWDAARSLEPGEVSGVVETEYGFHVLKLEERTAVPFEEASRYALLQRIVPSGTARAAMETWAATRPPVVVDTTAARVSRARLRTAAPDTRTIATSGGERYTAEDLAFARALLEPAERARLDADDEQGFTAWLHDQARQHFWSGAARREGVDVPEGTEERAREAWTRRLQGWASVAGLAPGLSEERIAEAALAAVRSTGQEARILRTELAALRPLLRRGYPVAGAAVSPESDCARTSEMRNSENTR